MTTTEDGDGTGTPSLGVDRLPALAKDRFDCPRCGVYAHQRWEDLYVQRGSALSAPESVWAGNTTRNIWRIATCSCCAEPSVWRDETMVFPLARVGAPPHKDMPPEVRALYVEAASVAVMSRRAGAALARATVEKLIKMLDPEASKRAKLDQRIERIKPRVSTPLGEMLDIVRVTGNGALHVDGEPDEIVVVALSDTEGPQVLELLLETANDLVDELITKPKTTSDLWAKLPEGIRKKLRPGTEDR